MRNNLNDFDNNKLLDLSNLFDLNFSPGIKKTYGEQFSFTYTPNILDWLNPRFTYNPRYTWTRDLNVGEDVTADLKSENDFSASFSLSFQRLLEKFYKVESNASSSRGRSSRNRNSSNNNSNKSNDFIIDQPHFKTILKFLYNIGIYFSLFL